MEDLKYYFWESLSLSLILTFFYITCLFKTVSVLTRIQSLLLLVSLVIIVSVVNYFIFKKIDSYIPITIGSILPIGLYTVISNYRLFKNCINVMIAVSLFIGLILSCIILFKRRKNNLRVYVIRFIKSLMTIEICLSIGCCCFIGIVWIDQNIYDLGYPFKEVSIPEDTIKQYLNTIALLDEENWNTIDQKQKLTILQNIIDIESHYLNLDGQINITTKNMNKKKMAYYSTKNHTIVFNNTTLKQKDPYKVLNTCLHECYHVYQQKLVRLLKNKELNMNDLYAYNKAVTYSQEYKNYVEGTKDYKGYYYQSIEIDARAYAKGRIEYYLKPFNSK